MTIKETILITGCAGLFGTHISRYFTERGHKVIGIDNLSGGYKEYIDPKSIFIQADVTDQKAVKAVFEQYQPRYVVHTAAMAAVCLSPFTRMYTYNTNLVGYSNLLNCSITNNVKRFLHFSSMDVYGQAQTPFTEDMPPMPEDPYGISKYAIELDLKSAHDQFGLNYNIIRPHNCYSSDTEVLTNNGWKYFKDVTLEDEIATLNPDENKLEYYNPIALQKFKHDDDIYYFNNIHIDLAVTKEHKLYVNKNSKKHKFITAETLENDKSAYYARMKNNVNPWDGVYDKQYYIIPEQKDSLDRPMANNHQNGYEKQIDINDWLTFLGWFISEGSCFKTKTNYTINISQYKSIHPEFFKEILELIKRMGYKPYYTKEEKEILIFSKQLHDEIKKIFLTKGAHFKHIPREILNLPAHRLVYLYDSLMKGDGTKNTKIKGYLRYSTCSKQLANDFQELLFKIGKAGTIRTERNNKHKIYRISILNKNGVEPQLGDNRTKKLFLTKMPYNDYVYDLTVPKHHIIYVRRNGKTCWSSNCVGTNQNIWDRYRNVLGIWTRKCLNNEPITVYGDGMQIRAFSDVKFYLTPIEKLLFDPNINQQIYNIGADQHISILDAAKLMQKVAKKFGYNSNIAHLEARHEVMEAYPSHDKAKKDLGFVDNTVLEETLCELFYWAMFQPNREVKYVDYEIEKGLLKVWEKQS